jgi:hypothetical protein
MNAKTHIHLVELRLDALDFPDRGAFADVMSRLASLGVMDCIELAVSPQGGGRLAFVLHRHDDTHVVRAQLAEVVGSQAIVDCRARPF